MWPTVQQRGIVFQIKFQCIWEKLPFAIGGIHWLGIEIFFKNENLSIRFKMCFIESFNAEIQGRAHSQSPLKVKLKRAEERLFRESCGPWIPDSMLVQASRSLKSSDSSYLSKSIWHRSATVNGAP